MEKKELSFEEYYQTLDIIHPIDQVDVIIDNNTTFIKDKFAKYIEITRKMIDIECFLALKYITPLNSSMAWPDKYTKIMWTSFTKNMYTIYSALDLTNKGLIGSARILMRYIFEFSIIGKYVSLSRDINFLSKWQNGDDISMRRHIFDKIDYPNSDALKGVWKLLCSYAHSTIYSQQMDLKIEENQKELNLNFIFFWMLLEMCYHLLNSHLYNRQIQYYVKLYDNNYDEVVFLRDYINKLFKFTKTLMGQEPKRAIYDFKLTWRIR